MDEKTRQLFILGPEIWSSVSKEDILATAKSMYDADIHNYPYDEFDIYAHGESKDLMKWIHEPLDGEEEYDEALEDMPPITMSFRYYNFSGPNYNYLMGLNIGGEKIYLPSNSEELLSKFSSIGNDSAKFMNDMAADSLLNTLLVLLATRNVDKIVLNNPKRYKDPLSKNGVKQIKNKEYRYITTIKIGKIVDTMRSGDHRGPVRPHLRRGHLRNQRIGEGRKDVKQIFIQPVFVNADDGWIENQRKEYRVKL